MDQHKAYIAEQQREVERVRQREQLLIKVCFWVILSLIIISIRNCAQDTMVAVICRQRP